MDKFNPGYIIIKGFLDDLEDGIPKAQRIKNKFKIYFRIKKKFTSRI